MTMLATYIGAAIAEIAGCFAFRAWLGLGKSVCWLAPGVVGPLLFAFLLTRFDSAFAGRATAASTSSSGVGGLPATARSRS